MRGVIELVLVVLLSAAFGALASAWANHLRPDAPRATLAPRQHAERWRVTLNTAGVACTPPDSRGTSSCLIDGSSGIARLLCDARGCTPVGP